MGQIINPTPAGAVSVLVNNPAATSDANAVYLISARIPGGTLNPNQGAVLVQVQGSLAAQAGGAAQNITTSGILIRNSVAGVPSSAFPFYTQFTRYAYITSGIGTAGIIASGAGSISLAGSGFFFNPGAPAGSFDSFEAFSYAYSPAFAPAPTQEAASHSANPNTQYGLTLNYALEILVQVVLVQNSAGNCIAPVNFLSWTPIECQMTLVT